MPSIAQKRWKLFMSAVVCECFLMMLSAQSIGWSNVVNYPAILFYAETTGDFIGVKPEMMISLRSILSFVLTPKAALSLSTSLMVAALACIFLVWKRTRMDNNDAFCWTMSLTTIAALVFSPHTHIYDSLLRYRQR